MDIYKPALFDIKKIAKKAAALDPKECNNAIYLLRNSPLLEIGTTKFKNEQGIMLNNFPVKNSRFDYVCTAIHNNVEETEDEIHAGIELLDIHYQKWSLLRRESNIRFHLRAGKNNLEKLKGFSFNTMWNDGLYDGFPDEVIAVINGEHVELWKNFHLDDPYIRWLAKSKYKWKDSNCIRLYEGNIKDDRCTPETAKWIHKNMLCSAEFKMWKE